MHELKSYNSEEDSGAILFNVINQLYVKLTEALGLGGLTDAYDGGPEES
jgi:hypothetical protein